MKKTIFPKICQLVALCSIVIFPCSVFSANSTPAFSSPKNKIIVTPTSPEFTLTLKSNPTTGYSWNVASMDASMFKNIDHQYVSQNSKLLGAPGYEVWKFKALYPAKPFAVNQVGHVVMEYKRPTVENVKPAIVQHFMIVMKKK